jgi:hypothetical protein
MKNYGPQMEVKLKLKDRRFFAVSGGSGHRHAATQEVAHVDKVEGISVSASPSAYSLDQAVCALIDGCRSLLSN